MDQQIGARRHRSIIRGHGELAALAGDHRCVIKQASHRRGVQRCRHHHQAQVLTQGAAAFVDQCEREIGLQGTFVKLIQNHRAIGLQRRV